MKKREYTGHPGIQGLVQKPVKDDIRGNSLLQCHRFPASDVLQGLSRLAQILT